MEFLPELISSIEKNEFNEDYEVLVGIDSCYDTLNYIYENQFLPNFKFFFFSVNNGPYVIKNTLCEVSKFEKILFFDSDDVMMSGMLSDIDTNLDHYPVIKPKYINFTEVNGVRDYVKEKPQFGEGVFAIQKDLFLSMNGFEGWEVAADSDFMGRLYKTDVNILHTNSILFHRRHHENSLTVHPNTGLASRLRGQYHILSKNKTSKNLINEKFVRGDYSIVNFENKELLTSENIVNDNDPTEFELKQMRHESISGIFSTQPKISSQPKTINYQTINSRSNHQISSQLGNALKKAKLEEIKRGKRRY